MGIEIANESGVMVDEEALVRQSAFVLRRLRVHPSAELSVVMVDEDAMSDLHERWMDESGPTDVMSFPMDEVNQDADSAPVDAILGDIVICPQVAADQAVAAGHSLGEEMAVLLTHGILHLLGYDHNELADERLMFGLQGRLVSEWSEHEDENPDGG